MHQCKDYHLQYLPIVLGIVSIISIFTGAGCFLGVALAVLGIVFGFIALKKHPESTKLCYTGIALCRFSTDSVDSDWFYCHHGSFLFCLNIR